MGRTFMIGQSPLFLDHDDEALGTFDFLNLHAFIKHWPPLTPSMIKKEKSARKRSYFSLARYAYIHETRHFHDSFGTIAGISLFFAHLKMLESSAALLLMLRDSDEIWSTPFHEWAKTSKFSEIHNKLLNSWTLYTNASLKFLGAFRPIAAPRSHESDFVVYLRTRNFNEHVPTFPLNIGIEERGENFSVYYPIDLVTLLEGNAQALQRSFVEIEFPDLASLYTPERIEHRVPMGIDGLSNEVNYLASKIQPYNVTDLMISKYLRLSGESFEFERDTVTQLTDLALSQSMILATATDKMGFPEKYQTLDVGRNFINLLTQSSRSDLINGRIQSPDLLDKLYSNFLKDTLDYPKPEDLDYKGNLMFPLRLIESIIRHKVIAPLLRIRLDSNHKVFNSGFEYIRRFKDLPDVPVLEDSHGFRFAPYMSEIAQDAWYKYIFLSRIVSELFVKGSPQLTCLRVPGSRGNMSIGSVGEVNFSMNSNCNDEIACGKCNGWYRSRPRALPSCTFSLLLRELGAVE